MGKNWLTMGIATFAY
ncbi:KxYKxGKxW signal peptide domain-containing protein [Puia dinghuensis]